jgi:hypothetical protein
MATNNRHRVRSVGRRDVVSVGLTTGVMLAARGRRNHPNRTIRMEVNGNSIQLYQLVDTRGVRRERLRAAPRMSRA